MGAAKSRPRSSSKAFVSSSLGACSLLESLVLVKTVRGFDILAKSATKRRYTPHVPTELFIWVWVSGYRGPLSARRFFSRTCTRPSLITMPRYSTSSGKKWPLAAFKVILAFPRRVNISSRCCKCSFGERENTITSSRYTKHTFHFTPARIISIALCKVVGALHNSKGRLKHCHAPELHVNALRCSCSSVSASSPHCIPGWRTPRHPLRNLCTHPS